MSQLIQQTPMLLTELFDIIQETLPTLYAYRLNLRGSNNEVRSGRRLADRLMRVYGGHWVWTDEVIATDTVKSPEEVEQVIRDIRIKEAEVFKDLVGIS